MAVDEELPPDRSPSIGPGTPFTFRMKTSRRILFIKNSSTAAFARSWVVDELGMHSRVIADAALLGRILTGETFDIVLLDQRGTSEELIPSIEGMRRFQPNAKLVVVSDTVALSEVQQAMRFNVHDIFLPPFEMMPIVERVDEVHARICGAPPTAANKLLARWCELGATLAGKLDAIFVQSDSTVGADGGDAAQPAPATAEELQKQLDLQRAELDALKVQLEQANEARAHLNQQITQLSAGASALGRAEARARALEAEVIELRKGPVGDGPDVGRLQEELEQARARIAELDRLNQGLLAGATGGGSLDTDERVRELEAELAEANARFEAAGQAFATEIELMMAREVEAQAALAAAEDRERKAHAVMASAGDAFGRADDTITREREEIEAGRAALEAGQAELEEAKQALNKRAAELEARSRKVDTLTQSFAADLERTLVDLGSVAGRAQELLVRREEIRALLGR